MPVLIVTSESSEAVPLRDRIIELRQNLAEDLVTSPPLSPSPSKERGKRL